MCRTNGTDLPFLLLPAILIFHAPKRVKDAFYYQLSTVYALLITCIPSLYQGNVTQPHATVAIAIVSSPVSICFLVYSIRAFWDEHRLEEVLGKRKYLNRGLVFIAVGIWAIIFVYTRKPTGKPLAQASCGTITLHRVLRFGVIHTGEYWYIWNPWMVVIAVAVPLWLISILSARKEIWPPGERYRPKFVMVW